MGKILLRILEENEVSIYLDVDALLNLQSDINSLIDQKLEIVDGVKFSFKNEEDGVRIRIYYISKELH